MGFLGAKIKKNKNKDIAIEEAVQALLRNEIIRRYREFEIKGEISILDKENLEAMFEQYKNLRWKRYCKEYDGRALRFKN